MQPRLVPATFAPVGAACLACLIFKVPAPLVIASAVMFFVTLPHQLRRHRLEGEHPAACRDVGGQLAGAHDRVALSVEEQTQFDALARRARTLRRLPRR